MGVRRLEGASAHGCPAGAGRGRREIPAQPVPRWALLSNHAHGLVCLAIDPDIRVRVAAERIGTTPRSVQSILYDSQVEGLVTRERNGHRNHYGLHLDQLLRHPLEAHRTMRGLVEMLISGGRANGAQEGD